MRFVVQHGASNFTLSKKQKTNIPNKIKITKMRKMRKIIKDIVKQQMEFAEKIDKHSDKEFIRRLTYKQLIITDDGVGRH